MHVWRPGKGMDSTVEDGIIPHPPTNHEFFYLQHGDQMVRVSGRRRDGKRKRPYVRLEGTRDGHYPPAPWRSAGAMPYWTIDIARAHYKAVFQQLINLMLLDALPTTDWSPEIPNHTR